MHQLKTPRHEQKGYKTYGLLFQMKIALTAALYFLKHRTRYHHWILIYRIRETHCFAKLGTAEEGRICGKWLSARSQRQGRRRPKGSGPGMNGPCRWREDTSRVLGLACSIAQLSELTTTVQCRHPLLFASLLMFPTLQNFQTLDLGFQWGV